MITPDDFYEEHAIVVVFDVSAPDRNTAAHIVAEALKVGGAFKFLIEDTTQLDGGYKIRRIESWWFPEADLKVVDGNDNDAMHLEEDDDEMSEPREHPHD